MTWYIQVSFYKKFISYSSSNRIFYYYYYYIYFFFLLLLLLFFLSLLLFFPSLSSSSSSSFIFFYLLLLSSFIFFFYLLLSSFIFFYLLLLSSSFIFFCLLLLLSSSFIFFCLLLSVLQHIQVIRLRTSISRQSHGSIYADTYFTILCRRTSSTCSLLDECTRLPNCLYTLFLFLKAAVAVPYSFIGEKPGEKTVQQCF